MKYVICPYCGAHLDHGEVCDCQKKREPALPEQSGPGNAEDTGEEEDMEMKHTTDEETPVYIYYTSPSDRTQEGSV